MDNGTTWTIIISLAGALSTVVGASFKYLLNDIKELKRALVEANAASASTNAANATLAAMVPKLMADLEALRSHAQEGRS